MEQIPTNLRNTVIRNINKMTGILHLQLIPSLRNEPLVTLNQLELSKDLYRGAEPKLDNCIRKCCKETAPILSTLTKG